MLNSDGRFPEMKFDGSTRELRLCSTEMEGEITPESDLLSREISVTLPVFGSQEIPAKLHGDSESFQESK